MSRIAFLFSGSKGQSVGMGRRLYETVPGARQLYDRAGEILGYDLAKLCFQGPAEQLDSTICSQPALFVTSLARWSRCVRSRPKSCWPARPPPA